MVEAEMTRDMNMNDDPRKLTQMISRVSELAEGHAVRSVVVGVADLLARGFSTRRALASTTPAW